MAFVFVGTESSPSSWLTDVNIGFKDLILQATGTDPDRPEKGRWAIWEMFIGGSTSDQRYSDGSRRISVRGANNKCYAAYFHPTKWHTATYDGGRFPWDRSYAEATARPGSWAICYGQTRWSGRNETRFTNQS
jgi:hypothetical protein